MLLPGDGQPVTGRSLGLDELVAVCQQVGACCLTSSFILEVRMLVENKRERDREKMEQPARWLIVGGKLNQTNGMSVMQLSFANR